MSTVHYVWDMGNDTYLFEADENHAITVLYTNEPTMRGTAISEWRQGATEFFHLDGLTSVREVTDSVAFVMSKRVFTGFGVLVASSGASQSAMAYCGSIGYYFDQSLQQLYVRSRMYLPETGQWSSPDRKRFIDGPNWFTYVRNNPVNRVDPSGELSTRFHQNKYYAENCGAVCYPVDWRLGKDEADGFIIQKVSISVLAEACDGKRFYFFRDCDSSRGLEVRDNPDGAGTLEYYEMWPVKGGDIWYYKNEPYLANVVHDRLGFCLSDSKTKTKEPLTIRAEAFFVPADHPNAGWAEPPLDWASWQKGAVAWAGTLASMCASFAERFGLKMPGKGTVVRTIKANWNCCCKSCFGTVSGSVSDGASPGGGTATFTTCVDRQACEDCNMK